ncbi:bacteriocin [Pseudoalteromonas fuliginea]|nr:bacteriocin [Pseudoalteromonas fuliginea]
MKTLNVNKLSEVNGGTKSLADKIDEILSKMVGIFESEK